MNGKMRWAVVLAVSAALLVICGFYFYPSVSLKPGVYIKEAHHYYGDNTRCHCLVIAGLFDDEPGLPVKKIEKIENVTGSTCTVVFTAEGQEGQLCVDKFPLSKLDRKTGMPFPLRATVGLISVIFIMVSVVKMAENDNEDGETEYEEEAFR